ncbi:hypothetical protein BDV38DRAFT_173126 [Aspergillus pseudotamarii]|uniref:Uncharacterized protein n=3 Tax=Aspergillus subgen. Circumdati TaxID=2720871 RepID=A0A5N6SJA6_ASPPS|nr:uncharacterized protein BDV38DRAFT_173126 [Aspergillus pseudotamarii]KAE8133977.1 hypothetical protein BDV38DRAFT_173126 [Aspergillus pseudotamarii]KAE8326322.1 hypothetical protein BDV39DRAFT_93005 [Aspergillus sergii]KAE8417063.1 hypothetical protein BDV36DRAFT_188063 [Aspergillus pseudocaelatus]
MKPPHGASPSLSSIPRPFSFPPPLSLSSSSPILYHPASSSSLSNRTMSLVPRSSCLHQPCQTFASP